MGKFGKMRAGVLRYVQKRGCFYGRGIEGTLWVYSSAWNVSVGKKVVGAITTMTEQDGE